MYCRLRETDCVQVRTNTQGTLFCKTIADGGVCSSVGGTLTHGIIALLRDATERQADLTRRMDGLLGNIDQCSTYYCTKYGTCIDCPVNDDQCQTFRQCAQFDDCVGCPVEVVQ